MVAAFNDRVLAIAVGPVTAGPLEAAGVPSHQPERARLGALAREVVARLPERDPVLRSAPTRFRCGATRAVLDGRMVELPPGPMAVLRELARRPGHVVPAAGPDLFTARRRRRARGRDGGHPAARRAGRPRRRDRGQARLPPGDLKPLVGRRRTGHHAGRRRCEGSRP